MEKYYILDGHTPKPVDIMEWALWMDKCDRHVKLNKLDEISISTVFLGINHRFSEGEPLLFETMIFGGEHDGYTDRYTTWEEAEKGHQRAIEMIFEVPQINL